MQKGDRSSATEPDEGEAIAAVANADPAAAERFVRKHAGWMLAVAMRIVRDAHHAEDAVQNAFAKVFDNIGGFGGRSALKTWMHRIVVNESLMLLRKTNRSQTVAIDELQPVFDNNGCRIEDRWMSMETPETLLMRSDIQAQVNGKIDLLPDNYRIILVLRDIEELSTQEVAQLLEISEANVKVRLHRARAALKRLLEPLIRGQAV
ncbi:sigma-70 family RNA polymerase sigma factor [Hoeflea poritis]|uniref:Sigma-70 family RNA polymerase sigma factor n=1 Tax=Hoeflea poritis TaxID=2993659 RepID=A0ABT4VP55_9HYPH|nr:sigma-70 family RNA polymerase sigma factor [Hoeflea poritis]MDA4846461.1 sigma-70 family RNA polymerase sigma factor [Hoeflea poritis]